MWLGEQGALAADNAPDALAIECSTLSHDWVHRARPARARPRFPLRGCAGHRAARRGGGGHAHLAGRRRAGGSRCGTADFRVTRHARAAFRGGGPGNGLQADGQPDGRGADRFGRRRHGARGSARAWISKLVADAIASGQAASPQVVRNVRRFVSGDHTARREFHARAAPQGHRIRAAPGAGPGRAAGVRSGSRRYLPAAVRGGFRARQRKPHHRRGQRQRKTGRCS